MASGKGLQVPGVSVACIAWTERCMLQQVSIARVYNFDVARRKKP